jgi:hypothetical protein
LRNRADKICKKKNNNNREKLLRITIRSSAETEDLNNKKQSKNNMFSKLCLGNIIKTDPENNLQFIQFTARISKNVQGGLKHRNVENQIVKHYEQPQNYRCLVKLYSFLSPIPRVGPFYRKPLIESFISKSENKVSRFSAGKIPINKLSTMFKKFYEDAGISLDGRNITNHSGRVTLCTTLYNSGYNDKAVASRSGHRSNAIQKYQREPTLSLLLHQKMMKTLPKMT